MTVQGADFEEKIYALIRQIPSGKVASYGQLAVYAGKSGWARRAGRALRFAPPGLPCHRVVTAAGATVPGWGEQPQLLRQEGVVFTPAGRVNMRLCRWQPEKE